jgi:uncharacterized membrane protein YkoI
MRRALIIIGAVAALAAGGAAVAGAQSGGDDDARDRALTGSTLDRAKAAALKETGGGEVTETEAGDEEGAYEVEVTLADGRQVDVHLDERFGVLSAVADEED